MPAVDELLGSLAIFLSIPKLDSPLECQFSRAETIGQKHGNDSLVTTTKDPVRDCRFSLGRHDCPQFRRTVRANQAGSSLCDRSSAAPVCHASLLMDRQLSSGKRSDGTDHTGTAASPGTATGKASLYGYAVMRTPSGSLDGLVYDAVATERPLLADLFQADTDGMLAVDRDQLFGDFHRRVL